MMYNKELNILIILFLKSNVLSNFYEAKRILSNFSLCISFKDQVPMYHLNYFYS